jgi:DNA-binding IclR family transcriptional regulator
MATSRNFDAATETASPARTVRSVENAIGLLRSLAAGGRPQSLSDLARSAQLSKPSTYHLLRTLEAERFVARNELGHYHLGWGVYEVGSAVTRSVDLTRIARPHLDRLADATGEATLLAIVDGKTVLYLDRGYSTESLHMIANVGRRSPLHTNASGKLLLAHMPEPVADTVIDGALERRTSATIVHPDELRKEIARIRKRGFATCWQESEVGLNSIAVPLTDYTGKVCSALTVAGPAGRVTKRAVPRLVSIITEQAALISASLGAPEA